MGNSNNTSFSHFIGEYCIEIPRIQRDYVQGRADSLEAEEKRDNFVSALLDALKPNGKQCRLDFIYGSICENAGKKIFIPLDGQQRLTTLFLLHWYLLHALRVQIPDNDEDYNWVADKQVILHYNFSYSTRESSTSFCSRLTDPKLTWIAENDQEGGKGVCHLIKQQPWFDDSWINDPTVEVMLLMLDCFEKRIDKIEISELKAMTKKLFNEQAICFDHLNLADLHQDESLYIKMNARGKKLNRFENWKSEFTKCIADIFPNETFENGDKYRCNLLLKDYFSYSMEHEWNDMFWELAMKDINLDTMENVFKQYPTVDDYFTNFLRYLHSILFFIDNGDKKNVADFKWTMEQNKETYFQIGKPERLKFLFECLDFLCGLGKDIQFYNNIFYRKKSDLDEVPDNKVRDFMDNTKANLFELCAGSHISQEQGKVVNNVDEQTYFDYNHWFILYAILKKCAPEFCQNRTSSYLVDDNLKNYVRACRNYLETKVQMLTGPVSLRGNIRLNDAKAYDEEFESLIKESKAEKNHDYLRIWLGDIPCFGGYSKAFDMAFEDTATNQVIKPFVEAFLDLQDYQKVQLLIGAGYKGNNMGFANAYTRKRLFFGGGDRWNVVFINDQSTINPIVAKLIRDFKEKQDIIGLLEHYTASAIKDSFAYYMLTYPAALTSTGMIEKEPYYSNAYFYYAVEGELDDMDLISIRSISSQPLSKEHIDPLVSAAICADLELFNKIKSSVAYKYRQSDNDGFSIKKPNEKPYFRVVSSKDGWLIDKDDLGILQSCGMEIKNKIIISPHGEDRVMIGKRIIQAIVKFKAVDYTDSPELPSGE